jgi:hypothetical protein
MTKIDEAIARVLSATTANFEELVTISGLDPATDFRHANLSDIDFSGSNLDGFDFTGSIFVGANFVNARIAGANFSRSVQLDAQLKKAIDGARVLGVIDSLGLHRESTSANNAPPNGKRYDTASELAGAVGLADSKVNGWEGRRDSIAAALAGRERVGLHKLHGASYQSGDGAVRAVCALSKRHEHPRPHYWYGYSPEWQRFLSQSASSFLVLACADRDLAYAIPNQQVDRVLSRLHRTGDRHWHIVLEETESGSLSLLVPNEKAISLDEFLLMEPQRSP